MRYAAMCVPALLILSSIAATEPIVPDADTPTYECHRATSPIVIDGDLEDPAWHHAATTKPFVFPWPDQQGRKQMTIARLLWDDDNLYVCYDCDDTDLTAEYTERDDPVYKDDCVEIFLAPAPDKSRFYCGFEMNCRGALYDYFYAFPDVLLTLWETGAVRLKTVMYGTLNQSEDKDDGWTLELCIPWSNFAEPAGKPRPEPGDVWRMNMNRWDGSGDARALSQWSPSGLQSPHPHRPEGFGALVFLAE